MKQFDLGFKTLRQNKRNGMTMIFALCATALLLAFSLSVLYIGSSLLATANRKAISERCYQKAVSFASIVENRLTTVDPKSGDLQSIMANRLDSYLKSDDRVDVENEFSFDFQVPGEDIFVSFKTTPAQDREHTRFVTVCVTAKEKGEQQTVATEMKYNTKWNPKFQPAFVEGN